MFFSTSPFRTNSQISSNKAQPASFQFICYDDFDHANSFVYLALSDGEIVILDINGDLNSADDEFKICKRLLPIKCRQFDVGKYCVFYLGENLQLILLLDLGESSHFLYFSCSIRVLLKYYHFPFFIQNKFNNGISSNRK